MSQPYFINKLLQIKDFSIKFTGERKETVIKGQRYHVLPATLKAVPQCCKHCGCVYNKSFRIHGYKCSNIHHTTAGEIPTIIQTQQTALAVW